jgi:hypothetical protein
LVKIVTIKLIRINETLFSILIAAELHQFTVTQIKNLIMKINSSVSPKDIDQLVRRACAKLVNVGFLEKKYQGKKHIYFKTALFDKSQLVPSKARMKTTVTTSASSQELTRLKATLNQYQVDLLGYIGEAEEFKRLMEEIPNSKPRLYPRYMNARNKSSTLMGKIKAVESCLNDLKGLSQ